MLVEYSSSSETSFYIYRCIEESLVFIHVVDWKTLVLFWEQFILLLSAAIFLNSVHCLADFKQAC